MKNVACNNDSHWAEAGNRLAALSLYEALAADLGPPERRHEELAGIRRKYIALELDH